MRRVRQWSSEAAAARLGFIMRGVADERGLCLTPVKVNMQMKSVPLVLSKQHCELREPRKSHTCLLSLDCLLK